MPKTKRIKLIGRREYVDFPELNIFKVEAKIDTGAYTSALHCHDISLKEIEGKNYFVLNYSMKLTLSIMSKSIALKILFKKTLKAHRVRLSLGILLKLYWLLAVKK